MIRHLVLGFLLFCVNTSLAASREQIAIEHNPLHEQSQQRTSIDQQAKAWGLTKKEYQHYLDEMASTPSGFWWKDVDPVQVLGMNARTKAEQLKYAKLDVKLDHERASREIAFQHAYEQAFAALYPNAKLIAPKKPEQTKVPLMQTGDQFYLFTKVDDLEGGLAAREIIEDMKKQNHIVLTLCFLDNPSPATAQHWTEQNLPRKPIQHNRITLVTKPETVQQDLKALVKPANAHFPLLVRLRGTQATTIQGSVEKNNDKG